MVVIRTVIPLLTRTKKEVDALGNKTDIPSDIMIIDSGIGTGKRFKYLNGGKYHETAIWFSDKEAELTLKSLVNLHFISNEVAAIGRGLLMKLIH